MAGEEAGSPSANDTGTQREQWGAVAGVSGHGHKHWGSDYTSRAIFVRLLALGMMAIAIIMALYAAINFRKRGRMLL